MTLTMVLFLLLVVAVLGWAVTIVQPVS
jgi:hypothetical protein